MVTNTVTSGLNLITENVYPFAICANVFISYKTGSFSQAPSMAFSAPFQFEIIFVKSGLSNFAYSYRWEASSVLYTNTDIHDLYWKGYTWYYHRIVFLWLLQICGSSVSHNQLYCIKVFLAKTSRSKTVAENFIRPQLNYLIFCTSTFHPSSINTSWALLILPAFNPSQPCRSHQQVPISSVRTKLFPNTKLWGSHQSSGSALSVSFPSNATHYHVCFSQVLIAKMASEFYPDSAKILKLNMKAQVVLSALPVYIVKGVIHRAGWEFPCQKSPIYIYYYSKNVKPCWSCSFLSYLLWLLFSSGTCSSYLQATLFWLSGVLGILISKPRGQFRHGSCSLSVTNCQKQTRPLSSHI